jgi:sugar/nucleoside kinase (ribokinase family)
LQLLMQVFDCEIPKDEEGLHQPDRLAAPWLTATRQMMEKLPVKSLLLTRGALGCILIDHQSYWSGAPVTLDRQPDADAVGAGDATAATYLAGVVAGWSPKRIVAVANWYGAWVASRRGATPSLDPAARADLAELLQKCL